LRPLRRWLTQAFRARIVVPLAVELAFALVVFVAIVATDGGRYGLGAKATFDTLLDRYGTCTSCVATVREVPGQYPDFIPEGEPPAESRCITHLAYGGPRRMAGSVTDPAGTTYHVRHDTSSVSAPPPAFGPLDEQDLVAAPLPWRGPLVHDVFLTAPEWRDSIDPVDVLFERAHADTMELKRMPGPGGRPRTVLVLRGRMTETELWLDEKRDYIAAVVWKDRRAPWTELYEHVVFDAPLDDALFDVEAAGLERLKQWIAERENARTK